MLIIYLILINLGLSNAFVDLCGEWMILQFKPFNCKPCLSAWLGFLIGLIALPFGSVEILVIGFTSYFVNKLFQDKLL